MTFQSRISSQRLTSGHVLLVTALLLVTFFIRAHNAPALPAFSDESMHITRAEIVWSFEDPAVSFTAGKLLPYYWLGLFGFDRLDALHGGRLVFALLALVGAAAVYRLACCLFGRGAGALAVLIYACMPPLIFHERMILADPIAATLGTLVAWAAVRLARRPSLLNGLLCGVLISLAILAKLTAAPVALLPLVAIWTLGSRQGPLPAGERWLDRLARWIPRRYWPALMTTYGFNVISGLPFILFPLFWRVEHDSVAFVGEHMLASSPGPRVVIDNLRQLADMLVSTCGPAAVIAVLLLIGRLLLRRPTRRAALYLLLCTLLPWGVLLLIAENPSNRYWMPGLPPLIALAACGLWDWGTDLARGVRVRVAPSTVALAGLVSLWIGAVVAPFVWDAWSDPLRLRLADRDRWEYFENFASGYGLNEAAAYLPELPVSSVSGRAPVVGLVGSCHLFWLSLERNGPVALTCPPRNEHGFNMESVRAHLDQRLAAEQPVYVLVEPALGYADISVIPAQWELIRSFPRPFGGLVIELYAVSPLPEASQPDSG